MFRAEQSFETLDEFEKWRLTKYLDGFCMMAQQDYFTISMSDESEIITAFTVDWKERFSFTLWQDYWQRKRNRYGQAFQNFIDDIVIDLNHG
jgi:hypothetical protein